MVFIVAWYSYGDPRTQNHNYFEKKNYIYYYLDELGDPYLNNWLNYNLEKYVITI